MALYKYPDGRIFHQETFILFTDRAGFHLSEDLDRQLKCFLPEPRYCGDHRLLASVKDFDRQLFFQFLDLHAECRLRNMAALGGIGKMPVCIDSNYIF